MSQAESIRDYKFGPLLGKREVDISSDDFVSPYPDKPYFTVTVKTTAGSKVLHYLDALGNEHTTEVWDAGKTVMGGHPGSDHPIPLFIQKVFADSDATAIVVAW